MIPDGLADSVAAIGMEAVERGCLEALGCPMSWIHTNFECRQVREHLFVGGVVSPENAIPF